MGLGGRRRAVKYSRAMGRSSAVRLAALALAALLPGCMPPSWAAGALLHPSRRPVKAVPPLPHEAFAAESDGATLRGWIFRSGARGAKPAVLYLHGVADNRESGVWIAERLVPAGHDVVLYDSRAHGASGGDACTYGHREKADLSRVLDHLGIDRAVVIGASLGAAVALQAAAGEPRIVAVVAAATFSDLASIARERVPWFATEAQVREAMELAGRRGGFEVDDVSPVRAARAVRVPVLLVHGAADEETRPLHSERVLAALAGPKQLRLVPGARHGEELGRAWAEVEAWLAAVAGGAAR